MNTNEIVFYYNQGNSIKKCSQQFQISEYMIKKTLHQWNVPIRSQREQLILENIKRKYFVNDNFFSILNSTNTYLIGFLAGDGYVHPTRNLIKIGLSAIDKDFLEEIRKTMQIERKILEYQTNKGYNVAELSFSSFIIKKDLAEYKVTNQKTIKGISMENIPTLFKWHYIRGLFDADGCYYYSNTHRVKISSFTPNILKEIKSFFGEGSIYHFVKNRNIYSYELNGEQAKDFMFNIYNNKTLFLPRKYEKFIKSYKTHETRAPQKEDEEVC